MKAGAVDFLTKPVDREKLLAAVRIAHRQDRSARAEREARDSDRQLASRRSRRASARC